MKKLAELVFIPCSGRGHITSTIEFAKLLVARDTNLSITVLIIKLPLDPNLAAYADSLAAAAGSDRLKFLDISAADGAASNADSSPLAFLDSFVESHKPRVRAAVAELVGRPAPAPRLAGFVVDMLCTTMVDVADEFAVPSYVFWISTAGWIGLNFHLRALRDEQGLDPHAELSNSAELAVPVFRNPVPVSVLPGTVFDEASLALVIRNTRRTMRTKGIVVNTLSDLEPHALRRLVSDAEGGKSPPVYAVGPILNLTGEGSHAFSDGSWSAETTAIIEWLDDQPPSSVIYLCFGSLGSFGDDQVKEIAVALERTGFRFLWSLRQHSLGNDKQLAFASGRVDPKEVLPEGFLDRTAAVGRVIGWAPQAAVLAHPAVGGFVSHCGWNSLLESLWFGVPVAAWPLFIEQQMNAFEMVRELGLAAEIKMDYRSGFDNAAEASSFLSAEEIEGGMRRVMDGESEMRKRVKEMSQKCRMALMEGGSSYSSLDRFVSHVFDNLLLH